MRRVLFLYIATCGVASAEEGPVDFTRDVRPILSNHCFACHGPDEEAREADLSLMSFEEATLDRGGYQVVVPGNPEASELWLRVVDADDPMPPDELHKPLTAGQKDRLRRWIEEGASYAPHWAYEFPRRVDPPAGEGDVIDRWIEKRLELEELAPSPEADPATLLRRVATDLTGLPPSVEELERFLADLSQEAFAVRVDALLGSPHHGERMALFWLDLVRYADTVGYHGDQEHRVWPYRDWVIAAFNDNVPFDAFTAAQLAGDLLPESDQPESNQENLVASTYNRLIQTSHEGGVQLEEYRAIYMADRVRNVSGVWMGATVGCAQCHDHKYDPYTARDYHALGAFFADIDEEEHLENPYGGLNSSPTPRRPEMAVYTPQARAEEAAFRDREEQARSTLEATRSALSASRAAWETNLLAADAFDELWVDDHMDTGGKSSGEWAFEAGAAPAAKFGSSYRRQSAEGKVQHYTVETERVLAIGDGGVLYTWVYFTPEHAPQALMLQFHIEGKGWQRRAVWGNDSIDYGRRKEDWDGYRRMGALPSTGRWTRLEVHTSDLGMVAAERINGWAFTQFGGDVLWDRAGLERGGLSASIRTALQASSRTEQDEALLARLQESQSSEVRQARAVLAQADKEMELFRDMLPRTLHTQRIDPPREVRILPRGNFLDTSGPVVQPAVPEFFGALESNGERANRLDLARWLTRPRSEGGVGELTARVLVNRLWAMLMGEGLCPSLDDFGGQGQPPTHLELLDTLALDLVASGWDVRAMLRRIVMTRAYQRSSVPDSEALRRDPANRLFARQSRSRLPAELVRDRILAVSGLLEDEIGGASVKPPQPEGLYRHLNFPTRRYRPDGGASQWRRGLYVHRQRQFLHPMLQAFDAPVQTSCTARRPVSNTPLAALNLLNDPSALEAARSLARLTLEAPATSDDERLAYAMRRVTGRHPSAAEIERLEQLLRDSLAQWRERPEDAAAFGGADPVVAAWTQVGRALLNLHETIYRD